MDTEAKVRNPVVRRRHVRPIESSRPEEVRGLDSGLLLLS